MTNLEARRNTRRGTPLHSKVRSRQSKIWKTEETLPLGKVIITEFKDEHDYVFTCI
jgi:hypothetical protein